jgi:hypothetical protein
MTKKAMPVHMAPERSILETGITINKLNVNCVPALLSFEQALYKYET